MKRGRLKITVVFIILLVLLSGCSLKSAGSFYKEGMESFNSGDYENAEVSLSKALELKGDKAEYYIDYAMTLIQLGKCEEALPYFDRAILDKDNSIVFNNNKLAYRGKGIAYFKAHKYPEAIKQFDKALGINVSSDLNLDILHYKGSAQEKSGFYEEAALTYTDILVMNSTDDSTYENRAYVYRMLGEYEKSLADYDQAIKLNSNNYEFYFGKYFLLLETGDLEGAASVLDVADSINGTTQKDKFNIAKILYYKGDYDSAIIQLSEAFGNGFTTAYFFLGDIYEKQDDYETAVYNYSMYIKEDTNIESAAVYNQIANCLIKLDKDEEALKYIQDGLEYNDIFNNQALKRNEIVAYENLGQFEKAYLCMTEYLTQYPEDEEAIKEYEFLKTRLPEVSTAKEE